MRLILVKVRWHASKIKGVQSERWRSLSLPVFSAVRDFRTDPTQVTGKHFIARLVDLESKIEYDEPWSVHEKLSPREVMP